MEREGEEDDARAAEMALLEAMYCQAGEFAASAGDPFACTLCISLDAATVELSVTLPRGYPALPPRLRATCERLSRKGEDALAEGMRSVVEANAGDACMSPVLEWIQDNAASLLAEASAPEVPPATAPEVPTAQASSASAPPRAQGTEMRGSRCVLWEERGDLFEVGAEYSLCHCVSRDLDMGAGIAVEFKKQFGGVQELQRQQPQVGGVVTLQKKGRFVYYLVTKNKKGGKPSSQTLEASLHAMRQRMEQDGVRKLAMPKIGCGLDRLSWGTVVEMVLRVFDDMDVELLVRFI